MNDDEQREWDQEQFRRWQREQREAADAEPPRKPFILHEHDRRFLRSIRIKAD